MMTIGDIISKNSNFRRITKMCDIHGEYSAFVYKDRVGGCYKCVEQKIANEDALKINEKRKAESDHRVSIIGIPKRYDGKTFDNFSVDGNTARRDALDTVAEYATDWENVLKTGRSMLFVGRPGTGKTHLAIALAQYVASNYVAVVQYTSLLDIMESIKDAWNRRGGESTTDIINRLSSVDLLIIDEISAGYGTQTEQLQFFRIINKRYENMLPTVMISNANSGDTRRIIGEATYDRLKEGKGQLISFDWSSNRK